jgi:hypothetical protein
MLQHYPEGSQSAMGGMFAIGDIYRELRTQRAAIDIASLIKDAAAIRDLRHFAREWLLNFQAVEAAPPVPVAESTLGSPVAALSSAQVLSGLDKL